MSIDTETARERFHMGLNENQTVTRYPSTLSEDFYMLMDF